MEATAQVADFLVDGRKAGRRHHVGQLCICRDPGAGQPMQGVENLSAEEGRDPRQGWGQVRVGVSAPVPVPVSPLARHHHHPASPRTRFRCSLLSPVPLSCRLLHPMAAPAHSGARRCQVRRGRERQQQRKEQRQQEQQQRRPCKGDVFVTSPSGGWERWSYCRAHGSRRSDYAGRGGLRRRVGE